MLIAAAVPIGLFFAARGQKSLVPQGARNLAETSIEFIEEQIVMPTIGPDGMRYVPFLLSLFFFIAIGNLFEVIPMFHMPANARMAGPLVLALTVYALWIFVGVKNHGLGYIKELLFPPGVPKALYILVTPIEFLSNFLIRPFSHAVRLFANMLAGHILLVTFSVLCIALWQTGPLLAVEALTFPMLVGLTAFEIGVALLQAFVFTILTGVYIGGALHPAH
ncbi:MAG: F0F1 ATP synthase subunit A [Acidimicrobiales bacterium]|nr:F0F1 ATP synthase subunit A [Acidimicrobiales bacterium]